MVLENIEAVIHKEILITTKKKSEKKKIANKYIKKQIKKYI
jgi:hypothetical protein